MKSAQQLPRDASLEQTTFSEPIPPQVAPWSSTPETYKLELSSQTSDLKPPDGGVQSWLTLLGAVLVSFSTFGVVNAFGAFSDFYKSEYLSSFSPTLISMIGAIQVFILYLLAGFSGAVFDAVGPRYMIPASGVLTTFSLFMLSLTKPQQIWQQYLTQAILFNLGATFGFFPSVAIIPHWFKRKTAFAVGCLVAASSAGGIVYPIILHHLIPIIGFGWSVRVIAFIVMCSYIIATFTIKARRPPKKLPPLLKLLDFDAFRDPCYSALAVGCWFSVFSIWNPFFYVGQYGTAVNGSSTLTQYFLTIMCATAIAGRVLPGFFADYIGRFNVMCISTILSSVFILALWYTSSAESNIIAFAALYGFISGPFFALMPACVSQISPIEKVGARIGMVFAFMSFGALAGTPIGGIFIHDETEANFKHLILFSGVMGLVGSAFVTLARFLRERTILAVV